MDQKKIESKCTALPKSPLGIIRYLLRLSHSFGSVSFGYHVAPAYTSLAANLPWLFIANRRALLRKDKPRQEIAKFVGEVHDSVLARGEPVKFSSLAKSYRKIEPEKVDYITKTVAARGIIDEYIIPVYGPFKIEACICFGFGIPIDLVPDEFLFELEAMSRVAHNRLVLNYHRKSCSIGLSDREVEVLNWMAKGKSQSDMAGIMGLKPATIDTYSRRIYSKFKVNNRVAAVLAGMAGGFVRL